MTFSSFSLLSSSRSIFPLEDNRRLGFVGEAKSSRLSIVPIPFQKLIKRSRIERFHGTRLDADRSSSFLNPLNAEVTLFHFTLRVRTKHGDSVRAGTPAESAMGFPKAQDGINLDDPVILAFGYGRRRAGGKARRILQWRHESERKETLRSGYVPLSRVSTRLQSFASCSIECHCLQARIQV